MLAHGILKSHEFLNTQIFEECVHRSTAKITVKCFVLALLQEVGNRYGNFSLATMFPRREFTSEDMQKTLLELELTPSASIVLLPVSNKESTFHVFSVNFTP